MAPAERHGRTNRRERMENQRNMSRDRPVKISRSLQRLHGCVPTYLPSRYLETVTLRIIPVLDFEYLVRDRS